jgi:hypothetical protein
MTENEPLDGPMLELSDEDADEIKGSTGQLEAHRTVGGSSQVDGDILLTVRPFCLLDLLNGRERATFQRSN